MTSRIHSLRPKYGPWAVVTGASDGIGKAFAELLAQHGFDLVLAARRRDRLQGIANHFQREFDTKTRVVSVDLSNEVGQETLHNETRSLDVGLLIAAAGFGT